MSKKRRAKKEAQATVVDEVLAEGSGPHAIPDEEGVVAVQVSTEPLEVEGDLERDRPARKGKGRKAKVVEAMSEEGVELEASAGLTDTAAEATANDAETNLEVGVSEGATLEAAAEEAPPFEATSEATSDGELEEMRAADGEQLEEIEDGEALTEGEAAILPTSAATMDALQLKSLVEALVFASDKPVTVPRLRQLTRVADVKRLEQALAELATDYEGRGLILHQVSGGYQFRTRPQYSVWVQQLIAGRPVRLSRAQLETLAIVAYRQPITRPEIDDIRGVDSSATLKLLLDRMLIRALGKKEEVGRPTLYGTTKEFLDFFSLGDLRELPTLREYSELSEESRRVMTARLGADPDGGSGEGGSTPPSDSGPMDGGPGEGAPDGASMMAMAGEPSNESDDDDDLGGATVQGMGVGIEPSADDEVEADLGGATVQSDGEAFEGATVHSLDGDDLDDATVGSGPTNEMLDQIDDTPPADEVAETSADLEDAVIAAEAMASADVDSSTVEPTE